MVRNEGDLSMVIPLQIIVLLPLAGLALALLVWAVRGERGRGDLAIHLVVGAGGGALLGLSVIIFLMIHRVMLWRGYG